MLTMVLHIPVIKMDEIGPVRVGPSNLSGIEMTVILPVDKDPYTVFQACCQLQFQVMAGEGCSTTLPIQTHVLESGDDGFGDGSWVVVNGRVVDHVPAYD